MVIQGINGNILELLLSTDKKVQDFFSSVKNGDVLKGRIIELFSNEGKAIINFKGFNIISQVPENFNMSKGDIINVVVTQINDKIQMKILNEMTDLLNPDEITFAKLENANNALLLKTENYINILKSNNIPINEQNLYIAQKLINYGLPVNKENIFEVSDKLINYFTKKGIDIRALNITNQDLAKNIISDNVIKFLKEVDTLISPKNVNIVYTNFKDTTTRLFNFLNISKIISEGIPDIKFLIDNDSLIFEFKSSEKDNINNIINSFNNFKNIKVNIQTSDNTIKISIDNFFNTIKNISNNFTNQVSINKKISQDMMQFLNNIRNILITQKDNQQSVNILKENQAELFNILNDNGVKIVNELKNNFFNLKQNIFSTNHTNIQTSIKDALNFVLILNKLSNDLFKNLNFYIKDSSNKNNILQFKNELTAINEHIKNFNFDIDKSEFKPVELLDIHNNLKTLVNKLSELNILKDDKIFNANNQNNILNFIDIESTIESIVFLKSRNLLMENNNFIDIMQKYFQNGMKLNQNIEYFLINVDKFEKNFISEKNNSEINNLFKNLNDIKNIFNKIAISTDENILNQNDIKKQIFNFIQKSGINLEAKIKNLLQPDLKQNTANINNLTNNTDAMNPPNITVTNTLKDKSLNILKNENNTINNTKTLTNELKDNLKSKLLKLGDLINKIDINKYNIEHKEIINNLKRGIDDLLTNLNALQFINQKPLAFDMLYTQLPVFINNKFFNGEIQVWYKKGSLKREIDSTEPLNIVFLLNTSNLGNVKVSMFIHKNDIECIVRTENEKVKQILNKNKEEFLHSVDEMNYKIKNFAIIVENDLDKQSEELGDGYINIGRIDLKA